MADRAEIKVTVDTREAEAKTKKAEDKLKKAEKRRAKLRERSKRVVRRAREGRGAAGARGGGFGRGVVQGVVGGRVAGKVSRFAKAAKTGAGAAAGAAAAAALTVGLGIEAGIQAALASPEFLRPLLKKAGLDAVISDEVKVAIDDLQQAARGEAVTSQLARAGFVPIAAQFARAGLAFSPDEAKGLSEQFVRASRRQSFLARQEANRTTPALAKALIDGINKGLGD